ncbi:RusA family crossover junction endodeoxyribonuclease [Streptomyces sp. NPDC048445]|uniref:RusA family crossover junction endodeoxyribonuclease n=1 Tax=Streptomyces sp. NPDC048445 TaxID=3365553 RepID=UPI0037134D7C
MTTAPDAPADETFNVYLAGEQINESLGLGYVYITTPLGNVRMTAEEADRLGSALQCAAATDRRMNLSDTEAVNPYLDPYPWSAEPALTVTVYGLPAAQGSKAYKGHRTDKATGRRLPVLVEQSKRVKPWRARVQEAATQTLIVKHVRRYGGYPAGGATPLRGPVRIDVAFTMKKPTSARKTIRTYPAVSPDLDKVLRSTFDALTQAKAWEDDGRVIEIHTTQCYPGEHPDALDQPGAIIRLYTLTGDPS